MANEVERVSNTYEIVTLNPTKISKAVVSEVNTLNKQQHNVLFWEIMARTERTIRPKALVEIIKDIKRNLP